NSDISAVQRCVFMNNRAPSNKRYQPTEYEHAANCATHALWIIPSIVGGILLYLLSDDHWEEISAWLYGAGLSSLFIISTVFHTISWKKSHLRSVEHCFHMCDRMVIYFFIAASYTPWLTLRDLGPWAAHMRWVVWVMASGGTAYVFFFHERYTLVTINFIYLFIHSFIHPSIHPSIHPLVETSFHTFWNWDCPASQITKYNNKVL
uniref:Monocyte to macrophage differentiation associated 2 n=1 Tax=Sinocyclocheilus anshuiensis TaxID=1608454 RepID=A0A671SHK6_9TELE